MKNNKKTSPQDKPSKKLVFATNKVLRVKTNLQAGGGTCGTGSGSCFGGG